MRMFKRPPADESTTTTYDPAAANGRNRVATTPDADVATAPAPGTPVARRWHDPTRAFATLLGVAVAGFLAWLTTRIGDGTNGKLLGRVRNPRGRRPGDRDQPAGRRVDEVGEASLLAVRLPARVRADADRRRLDPRLPPAGRELASVAHRQLVGRPRHRRRRQGHGRVGDDAVVRPRAGLRTVLRHDGRPRRGHGRPPTPTRPWSPQPRSRSPASARSSAPETDRRGESSADRRAAPFVRGICARRVAAPIFYSMTPRVRRRGTAGLLAHVQALASDVERCRTPRARLSDRLGPGLADLLVHALAGDQGMRRRARRA